MGLIQTFLDAFRKGRADADAKAKHDAALEHARSDGGSLGSTPASSGGAFDPMRPAPEPESGDRVDPGNLSVASADPEEGGEAVPPVIDPMRRPDPAGPVSSDPMVASGDPEEGGE